MKIKGIHGATEYRKIFGSLQYLTMSKPEIMFSYANYLCSWKDPRRNISGVNLCIALLISYITYGYHVEKDRRSQNHNIYRCGLGIEHCGLEESIGLSNLLYASLVLWHSNKQSMVSWSSTESEFREVTTEAAP